MLRSQSISSFTDKKKPNFFSALRTRKLSKDLNGVLKARPLSQLALSMNLNVNAEKRHSVLLLPTEDKENNVPRLRKHSSASNLKDNRRNSMMVRPRISGPVERVPLSPPSDNSSCETDLLDRMSPYTPSVPYMPDTVDFAPIYNEPFDWDDEPCSPSKLHRTANMNNINDFIKSMDRLLLPICNRASLEFEANEIEVLHKKLKSDKLELKLVENAMFLQFFEEEDRKELQMETRFWDDIDMTDALKSEAYSEDDDLYMYI